MDRHVPGDPGISPWDAVKVTGWAIRCTILRNNSERHLRRSLITFVDGNGKDDDEILEIGKDSYDTSVKFVFRLERKRTKRRQRNVLSNIQVFSTQSRLFSAVWMFVAFSRSNHPSTSLTNPRNKVSSRDFFHSLELAEKNWLRLFVKAGRRKVIDEHSAIVFSKMIK